MVGTEGLEAGQGSDLVENLLKKTNSPVRTNTRKRKKKIGKTERTIQSTRLKNRSTLTFFNRTKKTIKKMCL